MNTDRAVGTFIIILLFMIIGAFILSWVSISVTSDMIDKENERIEYIEQLEEQNEALNISNENIWAAIEEVREETGNYATRDYVRGSYDEFTDDVEEFAEVIIERVETMEQQEDNTEAYYTIALLNIQIELMESEDNLSEQNQDYLNLMKLYRDELRSVVDE